MRIKPVPGCQLRDPATSELIPAEGIEVPQDDFWLRRVLQGDVVIVSDTHSGGA